MSKVIDSLCENCDSEFNISFNENLVKEHEEIFCPFCGAQIETIEEDVIEEDFIQEDLWN